MRAAQRAVLRAHCAVQRGVLTAGILLRWQRLDPDGVWGWWLHVRLQRRDEASGRQHREPVQPIGFQSGPDAFFVHFLGDGAHDRMAFTVSGVALGTSVVIAAVVSNIGVAGWQNFSLPVSGIAYNPLAISFESRTYQPILSEAGFAKIPCLPGTFSFFGAAPCTPCSAGSYSGFTGASACTLCSPGTYQHQTRQTRCITCAAGTFLNANGGTQCSPCMVSQQNVYCPLAGMALNYPCPGGKMGSPFPNSVACV